MSSSVSAPDEPPGHGSGPHWGLASLFVGGLVLLLAPLTVIVNILLAAFGPRRLGMDANEIGLATSGLVIGAGLILLLGIAAVLFGLIGLVASRGRRQPIGLPLAGLLVSMVALTLTLFTALDTVLVLIWLNRGPFR